MNNFASMVFASKGGTFPRTEPPKPIIVPDNRNARIPPGSGHFAVPHVETSNQILQPYFSRLYVNADEAYRQSKADCSAMRRDPVIMAPLRQRQMATALPDWHIVPQDDNDPVQKIVCDCLENIIRQTPYFLKYRMCL